MDAQYRKGVLIVGFGALLFAPDSLMIRLMAMEQWPTVFWRGLIGGLIFSAIFLARRRAAYVSDIAARGARGLAFMVVFSATTFCFVYAIRETSVANALFLASTSPVFAALISWIFLGEPPDRRTIRTTVLALAGVGVIAWGDLARDGGAHENALLGDLAAIGAALCLATGYNISRGARPRSLVPMMGPAGFLTAGVSALFAADLSVPPQAWPPLLAMAAVIMPLATFCLTIGPRYIPAPEVSLLMLIEAIAGPLIVWWALAEYPGDMTLAGGAIVLGALAWSSFERLKKRA